MGQIATWPAEGATAAKTINPVEGIMPTQYTLRVNNDSALAGNICVYQTFDEQKTMANLFSLAWFSKGCNPRTQVKFAWSIDYAFCWSETGKLVPGVTFDASGILSADPSLIGPNSTGFTHNDFGYQFIPPTTETAPVGTLGIFTDKTVPVNKAAVGIAMSGSPSLAVQAGPNLDFTFVPHPRYWLCFGQYIEGAVIDLNQITHVQEIQFGPSEYAMYATLQADNTWKVDNAVGYNKMICDSYTK
mgnify:CR=1 FL=1